ncbi:MAG: hypothetical protein ACOZHQ_09545 [Thermodesulfobacteriota bacterium]
MARSGVQLCMPATPALVAGLLARSGGVALAQPKLNGLHVKWDGRRLVTSEGNPAGGLPHVAAALAERLPGMPLEGEAYCHGMPLDVIRAVVCRESSLHPAHLQVNLHVFDLVARDDQAARLARLARLVPSAAPLFAVPVHPVHSPAEVDQLLGLYRADGYEGLVIRARHGQWQPGKHADCLKLKPGSTDSYLIVRVIGVEGQVRALELQDSDGRRFRVGSWAVPAAERARLWGVRGDLPGRACTVRYYDLTARGVPAGAVYLGMEG